MEVLQENDERLLPLAAALDDPAEDLEDPPHAGLGREPRRGLVGVRHLEEVEEQRQGFLEGGIEQHHAPGHLLPGLVGRVGVGDAEVVPQQLEDGQEGDAPGRGRARRRAAR